MFIMFLWYSSFINVPKRHVHNVPVVFMHLSLTNFYGHMGHVSLVFKHIPSCFDGSVLDIWRVQGV